MVTLTDSAAEKIKSLLEKDRQNLSGKIEDYGLRVAILGGGCSGFTYQLTFDNKVGVNDYSEIVKGVNVIVDAVSLTYLEGTTIDWIESLDGSGFKINNPQATGTCGCGKSFNA
jgi:iron-sulfur cluster assembly protein